MKIWLDTASIYDDSRSNCDCPSPFMQTSALLSDTGSKLQQTDSRVFQRASSLHIQQLAYEKWLLCNPTLTGKVAVLDPAGIAFLESFRNPTALADIKEAPDWPVETIERMTALFLDLGFLQPEESTVSARKWEETQTLTVWMHITNACNLRCPYCYLQKTSEEMADDVAYKAVDALFRSAVRHHFKRVKLKYAGGEASLRMAHVTAIHDYAVQVAKRYAIELEAVLLSNGVALSSQTIENLKKRNIKVMISLDGLGSHHDQQRFFKNGHGSFQYVARTIERLLQHGLVPHIAVTVSSRNLAGLAPLMHYILERDMPFTLSYYRENECSAHIQDLRFAEGQMISAMRSAFDVVEQHLPQRSLLGCLVDKADPGSQHQHTCGVGQSYLVIDQHGGVARCHTDLQQRLSTIQADDPLQAIRDDQSGIRGGVDQKEGCRTCTWRYWCTGGCPLLTYRVTGRYDVKSPNCGIYQALFPEVLRLEALRLLQYKAPLEL